MQFIRTYKNINISWLLIAGLLAVVAGSVFVLSHSAGAKENIPKRVKGDFVLQFYPPGSSECGVHSGSCLTGTATGALSGDVFIKVNNSYPVAGTARTVSASNADLTITRPDGELVGAAAGTLDVTTGEFHNTVSWVGGTGPYADANGYIRTDGQDNLATGVENSQYDGWLHLPKKDEKKLGL